MIKKTLEEIKKIYGHKEEAPDNFEQMIPKECRNCGLLERDKHRKTIKCLYRTKEGCMLYGMDSRQDSK